MDKYPEIPNAAELQKTHQVAKAFRGVLVYFGLQYLIGFGMNIVGGMAQASPDAAPLLGLLSLGLIVAAIAALVMMLVQVYKCSSGMGSAGVLWVIAMFLPCLNLLTLLAINSKAKAFLENRGVKVGFLGPSKDEILRLEQSLGQHP